MMKANAWPDVALGLIFVAAGILVMIGASGLRSIPGMPVGPGLFPMITGAAMAVFGGILAAQTHFAPGAAEEMPEGNPASDAPPAGSDIARIPFIPGLLAAVAVAILVMPWVGFLITGTVLTAFLARLGGAGWPAALIMSPLFTLAVQWLFVSGLRVPLPPGLLG